MTLTKLSTVARQNDSLIRAEVGPRPEANPTTGGFGMSLILSRKLCEEVVIDHSITVKVVGFKKGRFQLAFDGPANIEIHRKEVAEQIRNRKKDHGHDD